MQIERIGWCEDCIREQLKENLCPYPKTEGYVQMHHCDYFRTKLDHTICEHRKGHYCLWHGMCSQKNISEGGSAICITFGTECELLRKIIFGNK